MKTQLISIQYARCIKWTQGQLDAAPWSKYETATAGVTLIVAPSLLDECIDYSIVYDGQVIGEGESENNAIADAQYFLMNESRQEAKAHAISIQQPVIAPCCHGCGKPATCYGSYEGQSSEYACDDCCGHACEDGECVPVQSANSARATINPAWIEAGKGPHIDMP